MLQKRWLGLLLVVVLAATAACGGSDEDQQDAGASESGAAAGLEDVPDVVAEVNGEEIAKQDFVEAYEARSEQAAAQQSQGGQQPDEDQLRDQVVQSLVNEELLTQEADRREIEASDAQVQKTLTELAQQNGMQSADQFVSALEKQGMAAEEIDAQAALQTRFDLLVADEAGAVKASDREVRALYEQLKAQQSGTGKSAQQQLPPLEKVRPQLVAQVESQQESEAARGLLDRLRKDADIELHV